MTMVPRFLDGVPFIDPFSLTAWMAAVTTRLKFSTSVLKLPIRNPVLLAKQVTSIAVITDNRFELGIGLSPWKEDFLATGTDYNSRAGGWSRSSRSSAGLETGDYFGYDSEYYKFPRSSSVRFRPSGSDPLWQPCRGRAAPRRQDVRRLDQRRRPYERDRSHDRATGDYPQEYGREGTAFDMQIMGPEVYQPDSIKRLADLGARRCCGLPQRLCRRSPTNGPWNP